MSFPRYQKYKDSGVEWLGQVPEHWMVKRLKHNLQLLTNKTDRRDHPVALENIESWTGRFIPTETEFEGEGIAFDAGDILFGKLRPYLAKAYRAESPGEAVGDFHVMRPAAEINSRFAQYQILSREFIAIVDGSTFGSKMPRASWDFVGGMKVTMPPVQEQIHIAAFLDRETAKIDELVEEQRRLIELLKEKRRGVISHTVTRGLNPHAAMKPSGIEWLGDVPTHWSVVPLKRVLEVKDGTHATPQYMDEAENTFPLITSKDFGETAICFDEAKHISAADHFEVMKRSNTERGDVLMSMIGGNIGKALIVETERQFSIKNVALFKTKQSQFLAKFLLHYLQSGLLDIQIDLISRGGAQAFLGLGDIRNLVFFKIPPPELQSLVQKIETCLAPFNELIKAAEESLLLMQERRSALISAAVTGQIDVRPLLKKEAA